MLMWGGGWKRASICPNRSVEGYSICVLYTYFRLHIFSSGLRDPADIKVPLCTNLRYPFLVTDPKNFLWAPLAAIYANFEGGARAKKNAIFLVNIFQKMPKNTVFSLFSKICLWRRNFVQTMRVFIGIWKIAENQFGRPNTKVEKKFQFFLKIRPPPPPPP